MSKYTPNYARISQSNNNQGQFLKSIRSTLKEVAFAALLSKRGRRR